jgi:hypothetical protein
MGFIHSDNDCLLSYQKCLIFSNLKTLNLFYNWFNVFECRQIAHQKMNLNGLMVSNNLINDVLIIMS